MESNFPRRVFLGAGAVAGGAVLSGCSLLSTSPDSKSGASTGKVDKNAKESPMLAALVKQKKLPALAERLPKKPMIIKPLTETGIFGGTLRTGRNDPANAAASINEYAKAGLVEWNWNCTEPQPGVAESWDIEDKGRVFVFHLREGLKWSDGQPFTTDDLMFIHDHVFTNKTLTPEPWSWLAPGGKPVRFEQVDKTTIRFVFGEPHGLLLTYLCYPDLSLNLIKPAHYLKQFHPDFVSMSKLRAMARQDGRSTWNDLYSARDTSWENADRPVMGAWRMTRASGSNATHAEAERNPYYWKVDTDGRQLPYIDKVTWTFLDGDTLPLRAASGQMDFIGDDLPFQDAPVLIDGAKKNNLTMYRWPPDGNFTALHLNMSHLDPVIRELFNNIDFRAALSHAINRDEVNQALANGQGGTDQPCGQPADPYFIKGMGRTFTEFDVDKANSLLDGLGLKDRDGDGYRKRPDGKKMQFLLQTLPNNIGVDLMSYFEFVKRYWKVVGIHLEIKLISEQLWWAVMPTGKYDIAGYLMPGLHWDIDPLWYVPTAPTTYWAPAYGTWYNSGGKEGEEPKGDIRQLQILYDKMKTTIDEKERIRLGQNILKLHDKNVWVIGSLQPPFQPIMASNDLVNVRKDAVFSFRTGDEEATTVSQLFYKNPQDH
ncbi:MAG TPA: ABC transporter substrate-binding protein [Mycobacteriales bacterium]|nr:ABC transporter substrate-binding protein [Mycobacteriales bacterium]